MKKDNGKVIVSLLAGATAGVVAGLLLAPETGEDTRKSLAEGADKFWNGNLAGKISEALARFNGSAVPTPGSPAHADQQSAEALLHNLSPAEPGDLATPTGAGNGQSVAGNEADETASYANSKNYASANQVHKMADERFSG